MYKIKLSPYSKIFYIEWLLDYSNSRYNLPIDRTLYGKLNVSRLRQALKRYIADHVLLNSHIQDINGEPHWVKNKSISELESLDASVSEPTLLSYVKSSFDLHSGPLYRFRLLKIDKDTHRLILVFHHIMFDGGASLDSGVFESISNYYNDKNYAIKHSSDNQVESITNLTNKLSVDLQNNSERYKKFWHEQLVGVENIDLSFLRREKNIGEQNIRGPCDSKGEINFSCDYVERNKLSKVKLKLTYGITPYIYGKCIFALLLYRYTGKDRIAISYPVSVKEGRGFIYAAQLNTNLIPYKFDQATTIVDLFD